LFFFMERKEKEELFVDLVIVCSTGRASNDICSVTVTSNRSLHFCFRWKLDNMQRLRLNSQMLWNPSHWSLFVNTFCCCRTSV
jgi:hypothetical protein